VLTHDAACNVLCGAARQFTVTSIRRLAMSWTTLRSARQIAGTAMVLAVWSASPVRAQSNGDTAVATTTTTTHEDNDRDYGWIGLLGLAGLLGLRRRKEHVDHVHTEHVRADAPPRVRVDTDPLDPNRPRG
jgi:MYXO-CTERM domain-containing protein